VRERARGSVPFRETIGASRQAMHRDGERRSHRPCAAPAAGSTTLRRPATRMPRSASTRRPARRARTRPTTSRRSASPGTPSTAPSTWARGTSAPAESTR